MMLIVSPEAQADLEAIHDYTCSNWSLEQADRYLQNLEQIMRQLIQGSSRGKAVPNLSKRYYQTLALSHMIFYRQDKSSNALIIVRVLHKSMDYLQHLQMPS